jgi:AcrR family transcriptional regulator
VVASSPASATRPKPRVGRPRDPKLDKAILQTVRELLEERGYQSLSVQEVTRRCGVHVRTITRRWSTKAALVAAAILGGDEPLFTNDESPMRPTGRLADDLRRLVQGSIQYLAEPATRAAVPALVAELAGDDEVHERFERRAEEWSDMIRSVLELAVASGDAPRHVLERAHLMRNVLGGTAFSLQSIDQAVVDDQLLDQLTDFLLAGLLADHARLGAEPASARRPQSAS